MGYDMYWKTRPKDAVDAYEKRHAEAMKLFEQRDALRAGWSDGDRALYGQIIRGGSREKTPPHVEEAVKCHKEGSEAFGQAYEAEVYYYRLNIWGMGLCREVMRDRGMMHNIGPHTASPSSGDFDFPVEALDEYYDDSRSPAAVLEKYPGLKAFIEAEQAALAQEADFVQGIPSFKFSSNDGWIVTPNEIRHALVAHASWVDENGDALPQDEGKDVEWWPSWLAFLKGALEHDGFEVF